jgi:hypothetical protein
MGKATKQGGRVMALRLRIEALEAELADCDTRAKHAAVSASLDDAWRQLREAEPPKGWASVG